MREGMMGIKSTIELKSRDIAKSVKLKNAAKLLSTTDSRFGSTRAAMIPIEMEAEK
jgi:hypothetical protein